MIEATPTVATGHDTLAPPARATPRWYIWVATAGAAAAGSTVYLRAYRVHHMQPVGWDVFGYIWQTKAVGHAPLSALGIRPGVPVLAALMRATAPVAADRALVVLPIVLAVALGLAAAGAVRTALRLPAWFVPLIAGTVLLWPGTARTLVGYEASLLLLVVLAAATGLLTQAGGRPEALILTGTLLLAACLTHVAIFAAFGAVVALYVLLSAAAFVRDRRAGVPILATDAGGAVAAIGAAGLAGGAILFGALGFRPGDSLHTESVSFLFRDRTIDEVRRIRPPITGPAAAIGAASAVVASWRDRPARALARLGLAWLLVAAAGVALSLHGSAVPGGRFLLFALPIPVLVAMGLGTAAWLMAGGSHGRGPVDPADGRRPRPFSRIRVAVAVLFVVAVVAGLARPGYRYIQFQYPQMRVALTDQLGVTASYVRALPDTTPLVVVVDQPGPSGAYTPKLRLNVIRAAMPAAAIDRTFVFVGQPEDLLAGRPTLLSSTESWRRAYDRASQQAWAQVRPALANGAVVLVLDKYDHVGFERLMAADPSRQIANGVYVLRGAVRPVAVPTHLRSLGAPWAAALGLWWLLVLSVMGWGFVRVVLPRDRGSAFDVACLAPAVGAGLAVPVALCVAAVGADPAGPVGIVALVVVALAGSVLLRVRSKPRARVVAS